MSVQINNFNRSGINADAKHNIKTPLEPMIVLTRPEKALPETLNSHFKDISLSLVFVVLLFSQTNTLLAESDLEQDILSMQSGTIERATGDEEHTEPTHTEKLRSNFIDLANSLNEIASPPAPADENLAEEEYIEANLVEVTDDTDNLRKNFIDLAKSLDEITSSPVPIEEYIAEEAGNLDKPSIKIPVSTKTSIATSSPDDNQTESKKTIKIKVTRNNNDVIPPSPVTIKLVATDKLDETPKPALSSVEPIIAAAKTKTPYNKYDTNGNLLDNESEQWACIHDTSNDLMWEVKSKDDALRNSNNLYSWFDPKNKKLKGKPDGGRCEGGTDCDTNAYVQAMNEKKFCGHNDWHLPTRVEMQTLVYLKNQDDPVKINKQYFPETVPSWYWTASENDESNDFAWYVLFRNGVALNDLKERPKHIRLVRNNTSQ